MSSRITTFFLPSLLNPPDESWYSCTAVVIDILRASSTMITALANGASAIHPCLEVDEARALKERLDDALVGGERGGKPIEGFDCSNSPVDYSSDQVKGRPVVFTTTNGTFALSRVSNCREVLIGAFLNLSALCEGLRECRDVVLLCAGTNGRVTREDVLFSGAVADRLTAANPAAVYNDETRLAISAWRDVARQAGDLKKNLARSLQDTLGGRNLMKLGYVEDLDRVAEVDRYEIVPKWSQEQARIKVP